MSDILIKNMEMPEDCRNCPFEMYYMNCGETRCRATGKILADFYKPIPFEGRAEECPLIEVSETADWIPYGREQEIYFWWGKCSNCGEEIFADYYCPFCGAKLKTPEDITQKPN